MKGKEGKMRKIRGNEGKKKENEGKRGERGLAVTPYPVHSIFGDTRAAERSEINIVCLLLNI